MTITAPEDETSTVTRVVYWTDRGGPNTIEGVENVAARAAWVLALYAEREGGAKQGGSPVKPSDTPEPPKPHKLPTVLWTGHLPGDPMTYRVVVKINVDDDDEDAFGRMFLVAERQGRDAMGDCCWYTISSERSAADTRRVIEAALLSLAQEVGLVAP